MTLALLPSHHSAVERFLPGNDRLGSVFFYRDAERTSYSVAVLLYSDGLHESVLQAAFQAWQETRDGDA